MSINYNGMIYDTEAEAKAAGYGQNNQNWLSFDENGNIVGPAVQGQPRGWDTSTGQNLWNGPPEDLQDPYVRSQILGPYLQGLKSNIQTNSKNDIFTMFPALLGGAFTGLAAGGLLGGEGLFSGVGGTSGLSSPLYSGGSNMFDLGGFGDLLSGTDFAAGTINGIPLDAFGSGLSYGAPYLGADAGLSDLFPSGITGGLGDYLGAPYQQGFNLLDPSTYGGSSQTSILQQLQKLLSPSSGSQGGLSSLLGGSGGSGASGSNGLLGTLLSTGPALGAIAYAQNQQPYDLSKLETSYNMISPDALALPYDLQTGKGRNDLTASLTNRGVMGSSFGNQDLTSYDTLRQLGRQNILSTGATSQANIANQILNAQVAQQKNKNDLYGRALLAMSGGLSPQKGIADLLGSL